MPGAHKTLMNHQDNPYRLLRRVGELYRAFGSCRVKEGIPTVLCGASRGYSSKSGRGRAKVCYRNRQPALLMNSVLRRSLRLCNSSVLQRQLRTSTAFHQTPPPHICSRAGWRRYSTHNPDGSKDRSAVGVSHLTSFLLPSSMHFRTCRCLPPKQPPSSLSPALVSIFTLDRKSNGCKSKSVSPCRFYPLVTSLKAWSREGIGITLSWSCPRRWAV